jgi:hypothetical protein
LKKAFSLLTVLIVVILFSFLSIKIVQNQTFSSNIDKLKYLELQGKIHLKDIEDFLQNNSIENYTLNDTRYELDYTINGNKIHIYLNAKNAPVRLYKLIDSL